MDSNVFAIVGAGFSGLAVAIQLLRTLTQPAKVVLLNRNHRFGRGMAYGTRSGSHLLNVPAGRMSASPGDEGEFVRFLHEQGLACRASDFVPRKLYGEYLEAMLERAQTDAARGVELQLLTCEVRAIEERPERGVRLELDGGRELLADEAVLALGNFPPRPPCGDPQGWCGPAALNDPWAAAALAGLPRDAGVLLAGSGLTAYDVVLSLLDRGHSGPITMMSRRGLLPQAHREQETPPPAGVVPEGALLDARTPRAQLREVRSLVAAAMRDGHDWRDVIGGLRARTPRLWAQLDAAGRGQFLRHLLPYWDTHRHRAAPEIHRRMQEAIAAGRVRVLPGRLLDVRVSGPGDVQVRWRPRGAATAVDSRFDAVVNCTGPSADLRRVRDPLIQRLREQGTLKVDPLGLGLEVDGDYRLLRADGSATPCVRYVGPLLKAQAWEATAVPELRVHAERVARLLVRAHAQEAEHVA